MAYDSATIPLTSGSAAQLSALCKPRPFSLINILKSSVIRRWILLICLTCILLDLFFIGSIQSMIGKSPVSRPMTLRSQQVSENRSLAVDTTTSSNQALQKVLVRPTVQNRASDELGHERAWPTTESLATFFPSPMTPEENARIGIVTFFSHDEGSQALKHITFPNFQTYANRHGYTLIDALEDASIYAMFEEHMKRHFITHYFKFVVMATLLPKYDWLMWADGDSVFLRHDIPLSDLLDPNYDAIFTINPKDITAWSLIINAGHYILRNTPWTLRFLQEAIYMSEHPCQDFLYMTPKQRVPVLNDWITLCGEDGGYWLSDQGILQWLIMYKPQHDRCHMQFRGFRDFNSEFPWYEDGDFIVHFPGKSSETRKVLIPLLLNRTDFNTGTVDRSNTTLLDPIVNMANQRHMYDKYYAPMNIPCEVWKKMVKPKAIENSSELLLTAAPLGSSHVSPSDPPVAANSLPPPETPFLHDTQKKKSK